MYSAHLFIGGADVDRSADGFDVINPADEQILGRASCATGADVDDAIAAARRGFAAWRAESPWNRATVLRRISTLIRERAESISTLLTLEVGKPLAESRAEVNTSAEYFDWCADEARRIYGYTLQGRNADSQFAVSHEPVGVVLALTAWNFPVSLSARKLSMALAAGCSVILRPAEEAPACVAALVRCCHDGGLPEGTVNLLLGPPETVVAPLMAAPDVRKVSFTGSTRVGQILVRQSAETLKRVTMELGGHAPVIVLPDAEIGNAAAAAAAGKFRNAGQVCTAPTRFLVHQAIADQFTDMMVRAARAIRVGDGRQNGTQMGPLATRRQLERAERLVTDARNHGATIACGGQAPPELNSGYFFEPTVITDLSADAAVLNEEPFAPLAALVQVSDIDEAIAQANALEFGLAAYVFGQSGKDISYVTSSLQAGVIGVNSVAVAVPEAPFGGVKQSGFGREGGEEGVHEYLSTKFVHSSHA